MSIKNVKNINKRCGFKLNLIASSIMLIPAVAFAAPKITPSQAPLAGVAAKYSPNITLALSVEFPTAGAAYSANEFSGTLHKDYPILYKNKGHFSRKYHGYFDNSKCYTYIVNASGNGGYFKATSSAATNGTCSPGTEFSGNIMNWLTMSALDIFRNTMTGGNRAFGTNNDSAAYSLGDTDTATFLRRANVFPIGQNSNTANRLIIRGIEQPWGNPDVAFLKQLFPAAIIDLVMQDSISKVNVAGAPRAAGFKLIVTKNSPRRLSNDLVDNAATFADGNLYFFNIGFTTVPARAIKVRGVTEFAWLDVNAITPNPNNADLRKLVNNLRAKANSYRAVSSPILNQMPVVVQVCDSATGVDKDVCVDYGRVKKPEGLLQQYARTGTRVATLGYLNIPGTTGVDGGVLRSRMKYLTQPTSGSASVPNPEWDANTGKLFPNPERALEGNSGAINYLNKFGDKSGYKTHDPAAELYYTAMRYLRTGSQGINSSVYKLNRTLTTDELDGFPAIYDWEDPLKSDFTATSKEPMCRPNTIIYIGDTNTHADTNLPKLNPEGSNVVANVSPQVTDVPTLETGAILKQVLDMEGWGSSTWMYNRGSGPITSLGYSPAGMAALAYWAHTTDTRTDIPGNQFQNNFIIDVLENGVSKESEDRKGNTYYMAAKYGGYRTGGSVETPVTLLNPNLDRTSWTQDPVGRTSDPDFPKGIPDNFALGNNPDNLINALKKALLSAGKFNNPSQAAPTFTNVPGQVIDLSPGQSTVILSTTYDFDKLTGDVVSERYSFKNNKLTASGVKEWVAGSLMTETFHNANYVNRNVYTRNKANGFVKFSTNNKGLFAETVTGAGSLTDDDVINYTLGDNSKEGTETVTGSARYRTSILGTLVSPTVALVKNSIEPPAGCTFANPAAVRSRSWNYIVNANDGMMHLLGNDGREKMAYVVSTAIPSLPKYAQPSYIHQYLNDGTPTIKDVCLAADGKAHTVVVSTAGKGGASIYALDATDLTNPTDENLLWEFSNADDADFGLTVGSPSIAKDKDGKAIAIVSSGYENVSDTGSIFILNLDKSKGQAWTENTNYTKIKLGTRGVGPVFVFDSNGDGIPEKLYAGDYDGNLWRVNYDHTTGQWTPSKLFTGGSAPFTTAPAATIAYGKTYVIAGTGQYLTADALDRNQQNYAYGFFDDGKTTITEGELLNQTIGAKITEGVNAITAANASAWTISENEITDSHKGWFITLPKGQVVTADANIYRNKVARFQSVMRTHDDNACSLTGATSFINVDLRNGGLFKQPLLDTNGDGKYDNKDTLVGMLTYNNNIAPNSGNTEVSINGQRSNMTVATGTNGDISINQNPLSDNPILRRLSWREIF